MATVVHRCHVDYQWRKAVGLYVRSSTYPRMLLDNAPASGRTWRRVGWLCPVCGPFMDSQMPRDSTVKITVAG